MKKIFALLLTIVLIFTFTVTVFAEEDKYELCEEFVSATSTGWWITNQGESEGYIALKFTALSAFKGFDFTAYCGENVKTKAALYVFKTDIDTSMTGTALWTGTTTISGNHSGDDPVSYSFGKTYPAHTYVLLFQYDGDYVSDAHFVLGSQNSKSGVETEVQTDKVNKNETTKETVAARLTLSTDTPEEIDAGNNNGNNSNNGNNGNNGNTGNAGTGDVILIGCIIMAICTSLFLIRKKITA